MPELADGFNFILVTVFMAICTKLASILTCLLMFQTLSMAARKVELTLPWNELALQIRQA